MESGEIRSVAYLSCMERGKEKVEGERGRGGGFSRRAIERAGAGRRLRSSYLRQQCESSVEVGAA